MITKRSQYEFVTGTDLDEIVIDGSIMPLRAEIDKLRGEDIAWLMEAWKERLSAFYGEPADKVTFSRKLLASQPQDVAIFIANATSHNSWVDYSAEFPARTCASDDTLETVYSGNFITSHVSSAANFMRGKKVESGPVEALFADMGTLNRFVKSPTITQTTGYEVKEDSHVEPGTEPWNPPTPSTGQVFSYYMYGKDPESYYQVPYGYRLWAGTGDSCAIMNEYAKSGVVMGKFYVSDQSEQTSHYAFAPIAVTQTGSTFTCSAAAIYAAARTAISTCGITLRPVADYDFQFINVWLRSAHAILKLRDRVRWTI